VPLPLWLFPPGRIGQVPLEQIEHALRRVFEQWGVPSCIKVDNGRPFGDPTFQLPPPIGLWLIGLDVEIIWNRPATPTDNAKVERWQGVATNWCEPQQCENLPQLQRALDKNILIQREVYPTRVCQYQPRIIAHPTLRDGGRSYQSLAFDPQRVWNYLARLTWKRTVNKTGQIQFFGKTFSVGAAYARNEVTLTLDPDTARWEIYDTTAELIKAKSAQWIVKEYLEEVLRYQRTFNQ